MSAAARPTHAKAWSMGAAIAVLLYLLSWGPVMAPSYFALMVAGNTDPRPKWALVFYAPVEWLRTIPTFESVSNDYWQWCYSKFYMDPFRPRFSP